MTINHKTATHDLLDWYDAHRRELPWRSDDANPYHVLLSEFMLQQTTVSTVKPYFAAFTTRWPTINDLANATEDEITREWAGLGYYSRARNLHKAAQMIAKMNAFPSTVDALRALPGVGPYTAAAIASIGFAVPVLPRDGNINRILSRAHAIYDPIDKRSPSLDAAATRWVHPSQSGDVAQAMMDLGSSICRPKNPKCAECPIQPHCQAYALSLQSDLPVKTPKRPKSIWAAHVFIMRHGEKIGFIKRPGKGLLAGMWALPSSEWNETPDFDPPTHDNWTNIGEIKHIFTHIELTMQVWLADTHIGSNQIIWMDDDELPVDELPKLWSKALALIPQP